MKLVLATRNRHKADEICSILSLPSGSVFSALDLPELPDVEEDGATLVENAIKKARTVAAASRLWALADDSGLEVDALGGAPGVFSAIYAGSPPDPEANNRKLLAALQGALNRRARFRTVLALASPDGWTDTVEGIVEGSIAESPRGKHGFGYDPLFIPEGESRTFAEMRPEEKNRISHRARALEQARRTWGPVFARIGLIRA
ncbi:MAG: RdgB/HAM1 family non-canonical purine NTP pyrophosphatase [Kiritimatiellae bacterium]|nr:RdgB/HAM1 family non-canonical purine NTP pyrophosphatase [Kiritimatiellia bacterium]MDW8458800.1 RdgB/HAM1 family non-canonical purine NTP pyrophosphatase [Verrucomicrobiota bacterium]